MFPHLCAIKDIRAVKFRTESEAFFYTLVRGTFYCQCHESTSTFAHLVGIFFLGIFF